MRKEKGQVRAPRLPLLTPCFVFHSMLPVKDTPMNACKF